MSGTLFLFVIGGCIAAAIAVSIMRKNKGTLTLLLDSTQLIEHETLKGNVQLALKQASKTEELVVQLTCIETIQFLKDDEEQTERNTVYKDATTLVGMTDHPPGHSELFPFEFTIPSKVDTTDLAALYRKIHAGDDPSQQPTNHHASVNAHSHRSNAFDSPHAQQYPYVQQSTYRQHSPYHSHPGHHSHPRYHAHPINPYASKDFFTCELQWQISAHLKSAGLDLEDRKTITLDVPNQHHFDGAYQY